MHGGYGCPIARAGNLSPAAPPISAHEAVLVAWLMAAFEYLGSRA
jgi:hypothetical protein